MSMSGIPTHTIARAAHTVGTNGPTVRLFLRTFSPQDAPRLRAYRSDRETARYQNWDPARYGDDLSGRRCAAQFCHYHHVFGSALVGAPRHGPHGAASALRGHCLHLAINVDGSKLVGDVAVLVSQYGERAGVNVTLASSARGRGYARAAVGMALDWILGVRPDDFPPWGTKLATPKFGTPEDAQPALPETFDASSRFIVFDASTRYFFYMYRAHAVVDPRNTAGVNLVTKLGFSNIGKYVPADYYEGEASDIHDYTLPRSEWERKRYPKQTQDDPLHEQAV